MEWILAVASFLLVILFPSFLLWIMTKGKARVERKGSRRGYTPKKCFWRNTFLQIMGKYGH